MNTIHTDVLVIGGGIAGLYTACSFKKELRVLLVSKQSLTVSNSYLAQGGIAVALHEDDSPEQHLQDTLACGAGLNEADAVRILTSGAKAVVEDLLRLGVPFDQDARERLQLGREGFHRIPRIVHAYGDATGRAVIAALIRNIRQQQHVRCLEHTVAENLESEDGRCVGAVLRKGKERLRVVAGAVVLATGGGGQVYAQTTNAPTATGDGYALASGIGAELTDMEFVQFHPTALAVSGTPKALISEAVRGEGARLVNSHGKPFMHLYHDWEDLAPRDIVSRAIFDQLQNGETVFLDATQVKGTFKNRFPHIAAVCKKYGIDPDHTRIPVTPATHFMMGGVCTDMDGQTLVEGLFACGETACTGVHGANRLASNSLLEGLVVGRRIAGRLNGQLPYESVEKGLRDGSRQQAVVRTETQVREHGPRFVSGEQSRYGFRGAESVLASEAVQLLKQVMWKKAGIIRNATELRECGKEIEHIREKYGSHPLTEGLFVTAKAIVAGALTREESRGAHFRSDLPEPCPTWENRHTVWRPRHEYSPIT